MLTPFRLALAATTALVTIAPAYAQDSGGANDIVVTARRVEERLQDVPISITVFNQQQLTNKNVTSAGDLATYTPSLSANGNFGADNTSFAIRGFVQDIGTAPSVGTYFGDVVTPRGATNGQPVGDGANPGDFWDLQNIQVLKGPQGTLQGRNTTGGAVLFVPQKPTDKFEGYAEGGYGNYNMQRFQAVINVPISDTFLVRAGFDHMKRDGYLRNVSGIGPSRYGDVDYWSGRISIVANLTPNLENYTIVSFNSSENNGSVDKLIAADGTPSQTNLFGPLAAAQLARQGSNFYNVEAAEADAHVRTRQWQIINTTTWTASDALTVKNITSYAELRQQGLNPIFGDRFIVPVNGVNYNTGFQLSNSPTNGYTAAESTFTEEFRLNGSIGGDRFTWQAGAYLEIANPLSKLAGSQSPGFASCANGNFSTTQCSDPIYGEILSGIPAAFIPSLVAAHILPDGIGNINYTVGQTSFRDVGLYAQATYKFTDKLKLTGGFRYTWDKESIDTVQRIYNLQVPPAFGTRPPFGSTNAYSCLQVIATYPDCAAHFQTKSNKPTWLIDLDYNPTRDILLYAKWARGYRQSVIVPVIPVGGTAANPDYTFNYPRPEKVDAYEAGVKTSWRGAVHGSFNVAGFYNKFSDQQLQVGFIPQPGALVPQTSAPVNAGKSTIYGAEVEATLSPLEGLDFTLGYTYLHTRIDKVDALPSNPLYITQAAFEVGDPEALSPKSKLTAGANYTFPFDEKVGKITIGGSVTYRTSMLVNYIDRANLTAPGFSDLSYLPALTLVNANLSWNNVASMPIDLNVFVTNLTAKKYYTFIPGLGSSSLNFEQANVGEPRMFGFTAKYKF
jgi:iron complex outermembrane receptor protein